MEKGSNQEPIGWLNSERWASALFCIGLALLATHEMDAMTHSEWELLPLLKNLDDATAALMFLVLHIPLFSAIFWLLLEPLQKFRVRTELVLDLFLIVHACLHFALSERPEYSFHSWVSESLIFGAAAFALLHIILVWQAGVGRTGLKDNDKAIG